MLAQANQIRRTCCSFWLDLSDVSPQVMASSADPVRPKSARHRQTAFVQCVIRTLPFLVNAFGDRYLYDVNRGSLQSDRRRQSFSSTFSASTCSRKTA